MRAWGEFLKLATLSKRSQDVRAKLGAHIYLSHLYLAAQNSSCADSNGAQLTVLFNRESIRCSNIDKARALRILKNIIDRFHLIHHQDKIQEAIWKPIK